MLLLYCLLAAALLMDFYRCRIPNLLILAAYLAGIGYSLFCGGAWYLSLLDSLLILILLYPFYLIGAFGGGDVKLFTVIALFLGIEGTINTIISALMVGAVCSVIKILFLLFRKERISFSHLYIHFSLPILAGTILTHFGGITWITF